MNGEKPITELLTAWNDGDTSALSDLMPYVVEELKRIAQRRLSGERSEHTLEPLALVNEVFIRMSGERNTAWQNRAHFFGAAAESMRRILVDHARKKAAAKRGGSFLHITLDDMVVIDDPRARTVDLIALHEALIRLETLSPRQGRIVELRFFGGLSLEEVAGLMDVSVRTVKRDWTTARIWLYRELRDQA